MLTRISNSLYRWARGWVVLSMILLFVVLVGLPLGDPELMSQSLDGRLFYTAEEAFAALGGYGEAGRQQMLWIHLFDFALLSFYTAMFSLSISWLFKRGFKAGAPLRRLNIIPLLGGAFDALENVCIIGLLVAYPAQPVALAWLASLFTTAKYTMGIPILLLLLTGLFKASMNRFKLLSH